MYCQRGKQSLKGSVISQELIRAILGRYTLPWEGTHGVPHWARVLENGKRLSEVTGAKKDIVELFAVFQFLLKPLLQFFDKFFFYPL